MASAAVNTFFRRRFRPGKPIDPGLQPEVDITDATVVFLTGYPDARAMTSMFCAWATGDGSIQLGNNNTQSVEEEVKWSVYPAPRFNPAADSDLSNEKFIFVQFRWSAASETITEWLVNNWRGTPKDIGIIYLQDVSKYARFGGGWLSTLWHACKAANLDLHPLRTVFLSTGWTEENCRDMYKMERQWIMFIKEEIRRNSNLVKMIRGEPRFSRMMDEDAAIATVELLFAPDS